ncbi:hypothetical protein J31TS4_34440 [Paenibacillus sp. J31TS4]|nr:hypothetical protein J31TS4_34440 [Paenibacillus sp. J31TS4]
MKTGRCPSCGNRLYEVTEEDFLPGSAQGEPDDTADVDDIRAAIQSRFRCRKCRNDDCRIKEVAMTGTGLSKLLDIQHNHYLFVSCSGCGYVEVYDPEVLEGHKPGKLGSVLDLLFGR